MLSSQLAKPLIGNRYRLNEQLGAGGMGVVYRSEDRLSGEQVALKRVLIQQHQHASDTNDTESSRIALSNEFRTLVSLRHPNIVTVIDYGFDSERQPYFTMDLLEKPQTITDAGKDRDRTGKIRLILEMLQALTYVHRRGIIHRDLKPGNVLVDETGEVKVLDFGLSLVGNLTASNLHEGVVGTIAYMSPEMFMDQGASVASDLYAVGVIIHELFAGRLPFSNKNLGLMINSVLNSLPDLADIDDDIVTILERLLAKNPLDRYASAEAAIVALCHATDQEVPSESIAVRESFLQAAEFVGRNAELERLTEALDSILDEGDPPIEKKRIGSAWLIGGESGVGKSRLMDEVRTRGLVGGALALRGQGVAEGGLPYQVWREPVRRLVLSADLSDTDAAILKEIVPDIAELLERPIPDVPQMEDKPGQRRLIGAITSLFRQQGDPVLLQLEDLQWAGESMEVLKTVVSIVHELPLVIIGTYRDDERPTLPEELPGAELIKLSRLSTESMSQLSASMLGAIGKQSNVIEFLQRETEGNAFFLVEVVRALAEEAGSLNDIGRMTLPQKVFAGGVQRIVQRRLEQVPTEAHHFLKLAAVAGRQLDLETLKVALGSSVDQEKLDSWLIDSANAAVLEVLEDDWRFSHDKLREGLLSDLSKDERRTLHRTIAEAIEKAYPDDREQALVLAGHWKAAEDASQERHYLNIALETSRRVNIYRHTVAHAERLLELLPPEETVEEIRIKTILATTYNSMQRYSEAEGLFSESLEKARKGNQTEHVALILRNTGIMHRERGNLEDAMTYLQECLNMTKSLNDPQALGRTYLQLGSIHLMQNELDEAIKHYSQALDLLTNVDPNMAAGTLLNWGIIYDRQGNIGAALGNYEKALTTFRSLGDRYGQGISLANLGLAYQKLGNFETARTYMQDYQNIARELGSPLHESIACANQATISTVLGEFEDAHRYCARVFELRAQYGDNYYTSTDLDTSGFIYMLENNAETAMLVFEESKTVGDEMQNASGMISSRTHMAQLHLVAGRIDEAQKLLDALRELEFDDDPGVQHLVGVVLGRNNQFGEARPYAQKVLDTANEELSQSPDSWDAKYRRAQALASLVLLSPESEQDILLKQMMEAYRSAYEQVSVKGIMIEQLFWLRILEPLDPQNILIPLKALLSSKVP